jgi:hypothetical protein
LQKAASLFLSNAGNASLFLDTSSRNTMGLLLRRTLVRTEGYSAISLLVYWVIGLSG